MGMSPQPLTRLIGRLKEKSPLWRTKDSADRAGHSRPLALLRDELLLQTRLTPCHSPSRNWLTAEAARETKDATEASWTTDSNTSRRSTDFALSLPTRTGPRPKSSSATRDDRLAHTLIPSRATKTLPRTRGPSSKLLLRKDLCP